MGTEPAPSITICGLTYEEYASAVRAFHGHLAPGMVLGGLLVDLAYRHRPPGELLDVVCETRTCLPDAVQLLTPCTLGNGGLHLVDLGRFALTLFAKDTGAGVRVAVEAGALGPWPEIAAFLFKQAPKHAQDTAALLAALLQAGDDILRVEPVEVDLARLASRRRAAFAVCPRCGEGYPEADGEACLGCRGEAPYTVGGAGSVENG